MVLAVGAKALKVVEMFNELDKEYVAGITFGSVSATYDREGPLEEIEPRPGVPEPDDSALQEALRNRFLGKVSQVPPAASAVKVGGERAYRKMRQGRAVDLPARAVEISEIEVLSYSYPQASVRVACSSGTYIRSLANDLGEVLRVGGYLSSLSRTKVGDWSLEDAVKIEELKWSDVMPLKDVLYGRPSVELSDQQFEDIKHGKIISMQCSKDAIAWHDELPVAILEPKDGGVKARKVL